jgi:ubiquinone/menaquinone biosynthesis C-methylase UbiE
MSYSINNILKTFDKTSNCTKILTFICLLFMIVTYFNIHKKIEPFNNIEKFQFKQNSIEIYDNFYADIYDQLVFNQVKNTFETNFVKKKLSPTSKNIILDIGCGTGHHVGSLSNNTNTSIIGIDNSSDMIEQSRKNYPNLKFELKDAIDNNSFFMNSFTHILSFYFTIYYFENKEQFFINCIKWLKPGGYLIVHLVDKQNFDPIVPSGNPLYVVDAQKYAPKRITKSKVTFNNFIYESNFKTDVKPNISLFEEKFTDKETSNVRKHEHKLYIEDKNVTSNIAQDVGFIIQGVVNLVKCGYDNQYLYVFVKPN